MTYWSLEEYCATQQEIDLSEFPSSTQQFFERLALPSVHPFCVPDDGYTTFPAEGVPPMGRLAHRFGDDESWIETIVTCWYMVAPPLLAMSELWLRLFAGLFGPCGILYLLWNEYTSVTTTSTTTKDGNRKVVENKTTTTTTAAAKDIPQPKKKSTTGMSLLVSVCIISVASTLVLMTDTLYVLENGPYFGVGMFVVTVILSLRACVRYNLTRTSVGVALLVLLAAYLTYDAQGDQLTFGNKADEVRTIDEGLYFDNSNAFVQSVVDNWPERFRTYDKDNGATFWMPTGDSRTGLPFLLNHLDNPEKQRVFLPTDDGEYVALDMAFPSTGHNFSVPVYLVLHGLNGGSNEEYIRDLTYRRLEEGSTVVVMVARGLMDLPVRG